MDKVLIVDGYSSVRELLAEELAGEGKMVVAVGNPASIPEILNTFEPDLVILDVFMNGKMKWSVLQDIQKRSPQLPVLIFTTTYPGSDPRLSRVEGWVIKSFIFDEVKQKINEVLKKKPLRPSTPEDIIPGGMMGSNLGPLNTVQASGRKRPSIH
jgi:CheY-like chemotaxis protein